MTWPKYLYCEQGTDEWFQARLGIPTASEFKAVLAKGEGKTRRKYMMRLVGEQLTGECEASYTNEHMERGKDMEDEARETYIYRTGNVAARVGLIRNEIAGASPDSLIGDDGLLEIKTKLPHLHLDALLANRLPPEHKAQVQGQLWVSGRLWCDFMSYWPKLPPLIVRVERDEQYIADLADEVWKFSNEMAKYVDEILAMQNPQYSHAE